MEQVYFDAKHPASFGGIQRLVKAGYNRKQVVEWLKTQRPYTLHKPARKKYPTRSTRTSHVHSQWQADLNDMLSYKDQGYRYILTVIDVFSRYAWALPLKTKTGEEVSRAFATLFKEAIPHALQTDQGKEFENSQVQSLLRKHNIHYFTVKSPFKASLVERFNRTLKTRMFRYFTHVGHYHWVKVLPDLVFSYNHSIHRSLGMTPMQATDPQQQGKVWNRQEGLDEGGLTKEGDETKGDASSSPAKTNLPRIGDTVRISKYKHVFEKGYVANWSEEVFTVHGVDRRYHPPMYTIKDENDEIIEGKFYAHELQVVNPNEWFAVEKIIRRRGKRMLVKFLGYPGEYWVDQVKDINKVPATEKT